MKYFKSKIVESDGEILSFIPPVNLTDEPCHLMYDRINGYEYHGIQDDAILPPQHPECEVEQVTFSDIEPILKGCRWYKEINAQIEQNIRNRYSVGKEISILKLDPGSEERKEYQAFVDDCVMAGREQKIKLGLLQ